MKTLQRAKGLASDLVVTQKGNTVTLWSASGVRHTVLDLGAPHLPGLEYARNVLLSLVFSPQARSFLRLGLGGGSIFHMLHAARPTAQVDAVEIDPAVPDLARKFFHIGDSPQFRIYVEDAAGYLARCEKKYDIIILDAYLGEILPPQCASPVFFQNARQRLTGEGLLVVNWLRGDPDQYRRVVSNIGSAVGHPWVLHGYRSRNTLLFAPLREHDRKALVAGAEQLERELPFARAVVRLARRLQPHPLDAA